ncbi:MAG: outer membrane protein Imp, required for envelope biosis / Organic solvent tolerance protein [Devosia sp.]|uniref:LPS-assembly protein LptD n=1 Tax=Devosia sp. TaxID=1871048 RepID=UPI00263785A0|nr:LPS assembly protein LptD [Devosia sp.]MDB5542473.1 outer membrane protein Imp, required for envelope biosis / Organic solvent tolerance protein [Devosia sp.]
MRRFGAALLLALAAGIGSTLPAAAQFLPEGFFATLPEVGQPAEVQANTLSYDSRSDVISAEGRVLMHYAGYSIACDDLRYEQKSGALLCIGNVEIVDPQGTKYTADRIEVTDGMKEAFIQSLTLTTTAGATVTARDVSYSAELETVLNDAAYSPCGLCIDEKGRRIGWRVKAAKLVQNSQTKTIYFEQPSLEVLGIPVAWLPWLSLPDPSARQSTGFTLPSVNYKAEYGARLTVPYFINAGDSTDIILAPSLMSRQGFLMAAEWRQRFDYGAFTVKGSGIYQLDPGAYTGIGNRQWRGAIQSSGRFELAADWTAGWTYTAFSDAAYLDDYDFDTRDSAINQVYATHLSADYYADIRLQQFLRLDNYLTDFEAGLAEDQQALALPNARGNGYFDLGEWGQVRANGNLLGVQRNANSAELFAGVPYVFGYEGTKAHATGEVSWQNQLIAPGGVVATPYLGLRTDVSSYDDGNGVDVPPGLAEPADQFLFEATPIAAIDFRWPLIANSGLDTRLLEPIAQVVYRGSDTTLVGITNDNAHSFVLDDTNLFSYDRFTGTDRQETGLRANVGARYLANFSGGGWLEVVGGQSFHLAGVNAFAEPDQVNTGVASGLEDDASYVVLGARGSPYDGVALGAKLQVDPDGPRVARAGLGGDYEFGDYSVGGDYVYLPAEPATGVPVDQHEATVRASAPLPIDYWKANGSFSWDVAAGEWLQARGELIYDDGYFLAGGFAQANGPTHDKPDSVTFGVQFKLKAPGAEDGVGN